MVHQGTIKNKTAGHREMHDITDRVAEIVTRSEVRAGWQDGNGHSHLQATMMGLPLTVPDAAGKLVLGTWQQIFHPECDTA